MMAYLLPKNWYSEPIGTPARSATCSEVNDSKPDLHEQRPRGAQDVVEASPAPLLRRPPPREELRGVARRGAHAPRLLGVGAGQPIMALWTSTRRDGRDLSATLAESLQPGSRFVAVTRT